MKVDLTQIETREGTKLWESKILEGNEYNYLIPMGEYEPLKSEYLTPVYISRENYFFNTSRISMPLDKLERLCDDLSNDIDLRLGNGKYVFSIDEVTDFSEYYIVPSRKELQEVFDFLVWFGYIVFDRGHGFHLERDINRFREQCDESGWESLLYRIKNNDNSEIEY